MFLINAINMSPNPANAGEDILVSVEIITWDNLKAQFTWDSLKNSGDTWGSIRDKAVDLDFSSTWDSAKEDYTWNSLKRYPVTWNELKGE